MPGPPTTTNNGIVHRTDGATLAGIIHRVVTRGETGLCQAEGGVTLTATLGARVRVPGGVARVELACV